MKASTRLTKTNGTYGLKGGNIKAIITELSARKEWGLCEWKLNYEWKGKGTDVTEVVLVGSTKITMPTWPAYGKQPANVKAEWDSMHKALKKHEDTHRSLFEQSVQDLKKELEGYDTMTPSELKTWFANGVAAVDSEQKAYDGRTAHGKNEGVKLTAP